MEPLSMIVALSVNDPLPNFQIFTEINDFSFIALPEFFANLISQISPKWRTRARITLRRIEKVNTEA